MSGARSQCPGCSLVARAPAAPPFLAQCFLRGQSRALGVGGHCACIKPHEQNTSLPAPGGSSGLSHSQEHLGTAVLPNPCHKEDKQGHCVYHLKVNLVHVKGAGKQLKPYTMYTFPTHWPRDSAEVRFALPSIFLIPVPVPRVQNSSSAQGLAASLVLATHPRINLLTLSQNWVSCDHTQFLRSLSSRTFHSGPTALQHSTYSFSFQINF